MLRPCTASFGCECAVVREREQPRSWCRLIAMARRRGRTAKRVGSTCARLPSLALAADTPPAGPESQRGRGSQITRLQAAKRVRRRERVRIMAWQRDVKKKMSREGEPLALDNLGREPRSPQPAVRSPQPAVRSRYASASRASRRSLDRAGLPAAEGGFTHADGDSNQHSSLLTQHSALGTQPSTPTRRASGRASDANQDALTQWPSGPLRP
jgi:hypothetical protein